MTYERKRGGDVGDDDDNDDEYGHDDNGHEDDGGGDEDGYFVNASIKIYNSKLSLPKTSLKI